MPQSNDRSGPPRLVGYASWLYQKPCPGGHGDVLVCMPLPTLDERSGRTTGRWLIAMGDVSGRGELASRLKILLEDEIDRLGRVLTDPASILGALNRDAPDEDEAFATTQVAAIDADRHEMVLCIAGTEPPLLRYPGGRVEALGVDVSGFPLWVVRGQTYGAVTVPIEPGDVVVFYSDGVTAVYDHEDCIFGTERLRLAIAQAPNGAESVGRSIIDSLRRFGAGQPQADDITILCVGRIA